MEALLRLDGGATSQVLCWESGGRTSTRVAISLRGGVVLERHIHPHIWSAVFVGGLIAACPIALVLVRPGDAIKSAADLKGRKIGVSSARSLTGWLNAIWPLFTWPSRKLA